MIRSREFGRLPDGRRATLFTLTNSKGHIARVTDYGATITELHVPDRQGRLADVVLGFDNLAQYLSGTDYIGATIGRVANRIANGRFVIDGEQYRLDRNAGAHHLHGGTTGFDKRLWQAEPGADATSGVRFTLTSSDQDQGYPGELDVALLVQFTDDDSLILDYSAAADRPTPVSLTNHSYFNLAGQGDILGHELRIDASRYLLTDSGLIPTGAIAPVADTPMDFTRPTAIGSRLTQLGNSPRGYDNTFVLDSGEAAVKVSDPVSGRAMAISTTEPTLQLYTANYFDGRTSGKRGVRYTSHSGFALEPGRYPDAVNHPAFPSAILRPGERYQQRTSYRFAVVGTE